MSSGSAVALGRKAERRLIGAADAAAAIDEGIEHQIEELVGELEPTCCAPVAASPESWASALARLPPVRPNSAHEGRRQRAAIVEEVVDRIGDVALICAQAAGPIRSARAPPRWRRFRITSLPV